MFSLLLDAVGAHFAAKYIHNVLLLILAAMLIGVSSSIIVNMAIYVYAGDVFSPYEILLRITSGSIFHSLFTLVIVFVMRSKANKFSEYTIHPTKQETISDIPKDDGGINDFVSFLKKSPSSQDIEIQLKHLREKGYDLKNILKIVRNKLGDSYVVKVERAI